MDVLQGNTNPIEQELSLLVLQYLFFPSYSQI